MLYKIEKIFTIKSQKLTIYDIQYIFKNHKNL